MQKKRMTLRRVLAAFALGALVMIIGSANGIAQASTEEPDFLVLNPERE